MKQRSPMAITVIKPSSWNNAIDTQGVVHLVYSFTGSVHRCIAQCGLQARWSHSVETWPLVIVTWTKEDLTCMTCIVMEARYAAA